MKFDQKYPSADPGRRFEFEYSQVSRGPSLGTCGWCGAMTRWRDCVFNTAVCSEECGSAMWGKVRSDRSMHPSEADFDAHYLAVKAEVAAAEAAEDATKDIVVVVHDQLPYFRACVESVMRHTENYHLYVWDNASGPETQRYIESLIASSDPESGRAVSTMRSESNLGFIGPNNELASWGDGEYLILLNSDTKVFEGWDRAMISHLRSHPGDAQVGYWGGHLGPDGRGFGGEQGGDVDYIPGWCFCVNRKTYQQFGLFSPELTFAYCEDADFSLRLKEAGLGVYALHAPLVHHFQNKTITEVEREGAVDVRATFEKNHDHLRRRWADYLEGGRVLARRLSAKK